jgi:alpha-1,2-mannosyltransferase
MLAVWCTAFSVYALTISHVGVNTDALANSLSAWRIATTGQPWMDGLDLQEAGKVTHFVEGRDGHIVTTATPGPKIGAAPFYLGSSGEQGSHTYLPGSLAAALWTSVAMALLYACLAGVVSRRRAIAATAVAAFATPVWSVSANALWTHPIDVLGLSLAALALRKDRLWLAGVGFAVGELARPHVAVIAAVVGVLLAWRTRNLRPLLRIGLMAAGGMLVLAAWSRYNSGVWNPLGGYDAAPSIDYADSAGASLGALGFFFSPARGLFLWTPLLLVLLLPTWRGWSAAPAWTRALALGGIAYTALQIYSNPYGGDGFWGYRHGLELIVCLAPLLTVASQRMTSRANGFLSIAVGLQFALIALGSIFDRLIYLGPAYGQEWAYHPLWAALQENLPLFGGTMASLFVGGTSLTWLVSAQGRAWLVRHRSA